jgi:hypothetical protein
MVTLNHSQGLIPIFAARQVMKNIWKFSGTVWEKFNVLQIRLLVGITCNMTQIAKPRGASRYHVVRTTL